METLLTYQYVHWKHILYSLWSILLYCRFAASNLKHLNAEIYLGHWDHEMVVLEEFKN